VSKKEWPEPHRDLEVMLGDGRKMFAVYTGDGWMFCGGCNPCAEPPRNKVVAYRYLNEEKADE